MESANKPHSESENKSNCSPEGGQPPSARHRRGHVKVRRLKQAKFCPVETLLPPHPRPDLGLRQSQQVPVFGRSCCGSTRKRDTCHRRQEAGGAPGETRARQDGDRTRFRSGPGWSQNLVLVGSGC